MDISVGRTPDQRLRINRVHYNGTVLNIGYYNGVQIYGGSGKEIYDLVELEGLEEKNKDWAIWKHAVDSVLQNGASEDCYIELVRDKSYMLGGSYDERQGVDVNEDGSFIMPGGALDGEIVRLHVVFPEKVYKASGSSGREYNLPPLDGVVDWSVYVGYIGHWGNVHFAVRPENNVLLSVTSVFSQSGKLNVEHENGLERFYMSTVIASIFVSSNLKYTIPAHDCWITLKVKKKDADEISI